MKDPIVEEIHKIRVAISEENGNDLHRIFESARRREGADGRRVVSFEKIKPDDQSSIVREDPPIL